MATWADIQRLAADLQRVQSADSEKKLSEANCIEVITRLINNAAIDIVVATNGKEYVTKKHLVTEIQNECVANGGRVSVGDLGAFLNVNLEHIEAGITTLVSQSDDFILCAGELLSREFINDVCKQLNDKLKETGQTSMAELTKTWDLPTDVFNHYILSELGSKIDAKKVEDQLYTTTFLKLQTNKLRACLAALSKPTIISSIFAAFATPESLFFNIWNGLISDGKLNGHVVGAKNNLKAYYVPRMHEVLVKSYIKKTFGADQFIGTTLLKKLSVNDQKPYFKDLLPKKTFEACLFLESGVVNQSLWSETVNSINEELSAKLYVNVEESLTSVLSDLSEKDLDQLHASVKKSNGNVKAVTTEGYILYDDKLTTQCLEKVLPAVVAKAKEDAPSLVDKIKEFKATQQSTQKKNDDDDDWGAGNKKKGKGGKKQPAGKGKATQAKDSNDYWSVVTLDKDELKRSVEETGLPQSLIDELFDEILLQSNNKYKEEVESALASAESSETKDMKKLIEDRTAKAQNVYNQLVLFEQSLEGLSESLALDLKSYLTKSLCVEISQLVLSTLTEAPPTPILTNKVRDEFIKSISDNQAKDLMTELYTNTTDLEKFHDTVKDLQRISVMMRFPDKKTKTETFDNYKQLLKQKVTDESDPPTFLLTALLYLYAFKKDIAVTCTGKYVGALIKGLNSTPGSIPDPVVAEIQDTQKLVVDSLKKENHSNQELAQKLSDQIADLKTKVLSL
ncbi:unnamed protein product [Bursaphelenchus okinawaensis]|uniref:E3 UFM1-protein ligase 1 homolog n=1 Tax=Bursaphelenchus okinawaensis TaxID=465554 RepID=A0A811KTC7_9BILA|nr:unnamed protein product [Bursaphelenchus okinawaensis]CAG9112266.1 unnamed protein product [Bursaphelenchus okinawaensis]